MMNNTVFCVSGFMRTGTSMMMKCLEAGGLDAAFNPSRDNMNARHGDENYKPNPGGFYELDRKEYQQLGFPNMYKGKLLKCLFGGLSSFVAGDYKIVFMMRDPEEIRQSYEGFFGMKAPPVLKNYQEAMGYIIGIVQARTDMDITIFQYREVLADPLKHFQILKDSGFPIDVEKATAVVDPEQCRFRREILMEGI